MCVETAFPDEHLMLHTVLSILCELSHNHLAGGHYDFSHVRMRDLGLDSLRKVPRLEYGSAETWIQVFLTPGPGLLPPLLLGLRHHSSLPGASASPAVLHWPLYSLPFSLPQRTFKSISLTQTFLLNSKHVAAYGPFSPRCPGDIQELRGPKEFPFLSSHGTSCFCSSVYLFIQIFGSAYKVSGNTPAILEIPRTQWTKPHSYSSGGCRSWTNTYIMSGGEMCYEENKTVVRGERTTRCFEGLSPQEAEVIRMWWLTVPLSLSCLRWEVCGCAQRCPLAHCTHSLSTNSCLFHLNPPYCTDLARGSTSLSLHLVLVFSPYTEPYLAAKIIFPKQKSVHVFCLL